jgi:hypothetical protein
MEICRVEANINAQRLTCDSSVAWPRHKQGPQQAVEGYSLIETPTFAVPEAGFP